MYAVNVRRLEDERGLAAWDRLLRVGYSGNPSPDRAPYPRVTGGL